jgi:hypothetical protein
MLSSKMALVIYSNEKEALATSIFFLLLLIFRMHSASCIFWGELNEKINWDEIENAI